MLCSQLLNCFQRGQFFRCYKHLMIKIKIMPTSRAISFKTIKNYYLLINKREILYLLNIIVLRHVLFIYIIILPFNLRNEKKHLRSKKISEN